MAQVIVPASTTLWDVANRALNDEGKLDPSRLSEADWANLTAASKQMKERALALASEDHVVVADPGVKIEDEGLPGAASAADVQRYIDANPAAFVEHAHALADNADAFLIAAKTHDPSKLEAASNHLDGVCEACHQQFWFPQKSAPKL